MYVWGVCVCVCVCVGGVMFDGKFVYVNIEYEIYTPGAHLRKGTLKPHYYYDDYYYWCCYLLQIFLIFLDGLAQVNGTCLLKACFIQQVEEIKVNI